MNRVREQEGTLEIRNKVPFYYVRYRNELGQSKREPLGLVEELTPTEVNVLRRNFMNKINRCKANSHRSGVTITPALAVRLRDYAEGVYLPMLKAGNRPSYFRDMRSALHKHIFHRFGNRRMDSLSTAELQTYFNQLAQDGRARRTALKLCSYLSSVYTAAMQDREHTGIEKNPTKLVKIKGGRLKKEIELPDCLKFYALLEKLTAPRHKMLLWFAVISGVRMSELRGVQWGDINWETGVATIRQSVWEGITQGTKSGKRRLVQLSSEQIESLRAYQARLTVCSPEDWLFPGQKRSGTVRPMRTQYVMKTKIRPLMQELDFKFNWHTLRHLSNNVLFMQGVDVKVRQERLGHADATITNAVYTHVPSSMQQDAARKTDDFWRGIKAQHEKEKETTPMQLLLPSLNVSNSVSKSESGVAK